MPCGPAGIQASLPPIRICMMSAWRATATFVGRWTDPLPLGLSRIQRQTMPGQVQVIGIVPTDPIQDLPGRLRIPGECPADFLILRRHTGHPSEDRRTQRASETP
jgi:hypothetical protein